VAGIHAFDLVSAQERLRDSNGQTERLVAELARR
jgi:hypothetical protein